MKVLIVSQVFYPDEVAGSQYLTDLASDMAKVGHEVSIISGCRSYENPGVVYARDEVVGSVRIHRIWSSGFSKKRFLGRIVNFVTFSLNLLLQLLTVKGGYQVIVGLSVPPLNSFVVALCAKLRNIPFLYWVMDLQPDEAIAAGYFNEKSLAAWMLGGISEFSLQYAKTIIVLDRFMAARLREKGVDPDKIQIVPPWPIVETGSPRMPGDNQFRKKHNFGDKTVLMYAGNHSICHPLDTLLEAARLLRDDKRFLFVFLGNGVRTKEVEEFKEEHGLENILRLGFQPREILSDVISSADLHAIVMGELFVGIVHPCKIYTIMESGVPFILVGPKQCHVSELMEESQSGFFVEHGQAGKLVAILKSFREKDAAEEASRAARGKRLIAEQYSRDILSGRMVSIIESVGLGQGMSRGIQ